MLSDLKEWLQNTAVIRLIILIFVFIALFSVLIHRIFVLQIINGQEYLDDFTLTIKKEKTLKSTRGNIYDRNGELLAYNELAFSVTIEDNYESGSKKNKKLNDCIRDTVRIIEENGDTTVNNFNIILNDYSQYEFAVSETRLLRFLADVYGRKKIDDLKTNERNATPDDVIEYLCSQEKYGIGAREDNHGTVEFIPMKGYTKEEILKIITVRYSMSTNAYQKYLSTVIASEVCPETVAAIMENKANLQGVDVEESTLRKYTNAKYMAHIIGYTGNASPDDLVELKESDKKYTQNDIVGKSGVEKAMEEHLQGDKGSEVLYVDNVGRVIETVSREEPTAGNDVYLSIDLDLQKAVYNMLEQKLAGILVKKIINMKTYDNSVVKTSNMMIPIDDVYYALFNNSVINIDELADDNAATYESLVYERFLDKEQRSIDRIREELTSGSTPYKDLPKEMQVYESYIVSMLSSSNKGVIISSEVDKTDKTYIEWATNETISLKEYLQYALSKKWIDISKIELSSKYSDADEIYAGLVDYICEKLVKDKGFCKRQYKYMIADNEISGREICMILYEQRVVYGTGAEKSALESGQKTAYDFIINKIANLEITPAQLALDPCSGSCVVSSVDGEILACVSYPGYDNNRLANTIDSDYYASLMLDAASPMYNYATQQMTAPGSTFKMLSTVTALEEGIVNPGETITCHGLYEFFDTEKKCWVYPGGHGAMDAVNAIGNSCNVFFYDVGFRLATDGFTKNYDEQHGLERLKKYADMFGLTEKTGVETEENESKFSETLPVDSAIGQGSHNYTTIALSRYLTTVASKGNCYNLSLVDRVVDGDGKLIKKYGPSLRNHVDISDNTWTSVHRGMRLVVEKSSAFKDVSINVAGKTGTAQTSKSRTNHALFLGFAPYENPEVTVAVRIAYGYTSANAAALAADVIKYKFNLDDTDSLVTGIADTNEVEVIDD
ncbi:MAG: penicillin-binding transpeptidase domain-containing protein [Lachnospiraceae bacterium]|nr:penicillin-binding transpeptidase domain-containing protein [Lachnospiraceae bacterium]